MLVQQITEKQIAGAGRVVQPGFTFLQRPRPLPAKVSHLPLPPKEGRASKFSGDACGKSMKLFTDATN